METVELENEELAMEIQSVKSENEIIQDRFAAQAKKIEEQNQLIAQQNVKMQAQNERLEKLERIALATTPTPTTASVENKKTSVFNLSNLFSSLKGFWVSSN